MTYQNHTMNKSQLSDMLLDGINVINFNNTTLFDNYYEDIINLIKKQCKDYIIVDNINYIEDLHEMCKQNKTVFCMIPLNYLSTTLTFKYIICCVC